MRLVDIDSLKGCAIIRPTTHEEIAHIQSCSGWIAHKDIPTAYDVEAVVAELENKMLASSNAQTEAIIGMQGASANYYCGEKDAYQKAIEIVRNGGKE